VRSDLREPFERCRTLCGIALALAQSAAAAPPPIAAAPPPIAAAPPPPIEPQTPPVRRRRPQTPPAALEGFTPREQSRLASCSPPLQAALARLLSHLTAAPPPIG
jgi:hypothetical protein